MMRYVKTLMITVAVLLVPLTVSAEPGVSGNHFGARQNVVITTMMCDTVDQLESILVAQVERGVAAGQQAYLALRATPNAMREPTCLVAAYRVTVLDVAAVVEGVPGPDGMRRTVYILYVLINEHPYVILSPMPVGPRDNPV